MSIEYDSVEEVEDIIINYIRDQNRELMEDGEPPLTLEDFLREPDLQRTLNDLRSFGYQESNIRELIRYALSSLNVFTEDPDEAYQPSARLENALGQMDLYPLARPNVVSGADMVFNQLNDVSLVQFYQHMPSGYYSNCWSEIDELCGVCLFLLNDGSPKVKLNPCGHCFHHQCADHWLKLKNNCPKCRSVPILGQVFTPERRSFRRYSEPMSRHRSSRRSSY